MWSSILERERETFIKRQPPIGEKDDDDSENSWISDGLQKEEERRGKGAGGRVEREVERSKVDVGVDGAKKEIMVKRRCGPVGLLHESH